MNHQQKYAAKMTAFEAMGLAAMLPGMQHMITLMQRELDNMRAALARIQERQNGYEETAEETAPRGKGSAQAAYWARMTPEERSAEMTRRLMLRDKKSAAKTAGADLDRLHPRDVRSPRHEAWVKKMRAANKRTWSNYTPEQRAARVAHASAHYGKGKAA
jgi:hypothetical protein